MSLHSVTRRLAEATSIIRTRRDDDDRLDEHGGTIAELRERQRAAEVPLEKLVARLRSKF